MSRRPLDTREWLEDMLRFAGRDADRAREVLDLMARAEASEDLMQKMIAGQKTGDADADEIIGQLSELDSLKVWAKRDQTFKELGELDEESLEQFARAYDTHETQSFALHDLLVEAGLLDPNDYATDPLPLLRMFLPVH